MKRLIIVALVLSVLLSAAPVSMASRPTANCQGNYCDSGGGYYSSSGSTIRGSYQRSTSSVAVKVSGGTARPNWQQVVNAVNKNTRGTVVTRGNVYRGSDGWYVNVQSVRRK